MTLTTAPSEGEEVGRAVPWPPLIKSAADKGRLKFQVNPLCSGVLGLGCVLESRTSFKKH